MIAIVDYGLGNIRAFGNIYNRLNIPFCYADTEEKLYQASRIILPGVGAFDFAMNKLEDSGLVDCLNDLVLMKKVPVLGICVGMQIMARSSAEGQREGLGWLNTCVEKFPAGELPLPHMGWNNLELSVNSPLFVGLDPDPQFYFLHSYYFSSQCKGVIAKARYSCDIGCVVNQENIYGIQCHPEKSHHNGVTLLKNFSGDL